MQIPHSPFAGALITSSENRNVLMMPGVFNETMQLLLDAHEYFELFGEDDQDNIAESDRSIYSCEMSRITLRLSSVMAWLLVRKAVFSGKITDIEATEKFRMECHDICVFENAEAIDVLPPFMQYLLERTLELYQRVCRLDAMVQETTHH